MITEIVAIFKIILLRFQSKQYQTNVLSTVALKTILFVNWNTSDNLSNFRRLLHKQNKKNKQTTYVLVLSNT